MEGSGGVWVSCGSNDEAARLTSDGNDNATDGEGGLSLLNLV